MQLTPYNDGPTGGHGVRVALTDGTEADVATVYSVYGDNAGWNVRARCDTVCSPEEARALAALLLLAALNAESEE